MVSSTAFKATKGMKLKPYTYKVEKGKMRELAIAIGDHKEEYLNGEKIPPTFATVVEYWGGGASNAELLGLNVKRVLFGEQEYEYLGTISSGDVLTITGFVEDVYTKAVMDFYVVTKEFKNQIGETVLISRSTLIERH